jgi:hypothetical protein
MRVTYILLVKKIVYIIAYQTSYYDPVFEIGYNPFIVHTRS